MALETLKGLQQLNRFKIGRGSLDAGGLTDNHSIIVDDASNSILFKIQNGPIKEVGLNGCQVDEILLIAKEILVGLNLNFPNKHNEAAILHIDNAVTSLALRRIDREKRSVEGYNKP